MNAGLPGTGIGGFFYLLASGWMQVRECWSKINKRHDLSRSNVARKQIPITLCVIAGTWATGELIGRLLLLVPRTLGRRNRFFDLLALSNGKYNFWSRSILYWTLATLISLYLMMQGMRLATKISGYVSSRRVLRNTAAFPALQVSGRLEPIRTLESISRTPSRSDT